MTASLAEREGFFSAYFAYRSEFSSSRFIYGVIVPLPKADAEHKTITTAKSRERSFFIVIPRYRSGLNKKISYLLIFYKINDKKTIAEKTVAASIYLF